ncbi:SIR2 family protein [Clostridiaceae bacterium OttesenSCG-928-D20]|nr:SIR2 family protein [Clostridiaceae bacterium OttesenSCG-928-D20]
MKQELFVKKYAKNMRLGRAAVFVGAGMSAGAGYVDWKSLLKDVATELNLDIAKEDDLISLAQYYVSYKQNKKPLIEAIIENLSTAKTPTLSHEILASMPLDTYWTTNYDDMIEKALIDKGKRLDVKRSDKDLLYPIKGSDATVYKMHGDITASSDAVITKEDYELYPDTHGSMLNVLRGDLTTKSFLFLGYGFNDPDLIDLLSRIRCMVGEEKQEHFAVVRKIKENEYASKDEYEYAQRKRVLQNNDFKRYGIEVIEIEDFSNIPDILRKIAIQVNKENIFISAAIAESQQGSLDECLIRKLVNALLDISDESRVISGYGLNIGPIIVDEAMQYLKSHKDRKFDEKVKLYPFAVGQPSDWTQYRKLMLADTGVCIMLYGTKDDGNQIINSNGMLEEYNIAENNSALIIPIGSTGGMSAEIASELIGADYHKNDLLYLQKETDSQKIVDKVISMIRQHKNDVEGGE